MANPNHVVFEQPLNELMRVLLRLEYLFGKLNHHKMGSFSWDSRYCLDALFDMLDVLDRADFRNKLNKEVQKQYNYLQQLSTAPQVDREKLQHLIDELQGYQDYLQESNGRFGQSLRENAFLNSIRPHHSYPGGTSPFNTPGFYLWLQQDMQTQQQHINQWLSGVVPLAALTKTLLKMTRESHPAQLQKAHKGYFQMSLNPQQPCQLLRVTVPVEEQVFPRISASRHALNIRFLAADLLQKAMQTEQNITFYLTCCTL